MGMKSIFIFLMLLISSKIVLAADNLSFQGNLVIPNCKINAGNVVQVNWGGVEIQSLTSSDVPYYEKLFNIPIECPYSVGTPKMKITANVHEQAGWAGIQTTKYDEGLLVYLRTKANGSWVKYNRFSNIPSDSITGSGTNKSMTLYASLGRYKDIEHLKPGPFSAGATLEVRYE